MKVRTQNIFATRIVNFSVQPTVVKVGDTITISGNLQWFCPPIMCPPFGSWMGYENQTVELYVNGRKVDETTTVGEGSFTFRKTFNEGEYEISVYYPGSWKDNPCWSPKVVVRVLNPEEYEKEEQNTTMNTLLIYGALAIGLIAVGTWLALIYKLATG